MKQVKFKYFLIVFLVAFASFGVVKPASAHGNSRNLEIASMPIGDSFLSVWSTPSILRPGEVHFISSILDARDMPVTDCAITVRVVSGADETVVMESMAMLDGADDALFEAQFELENAGIYQVQVEILEPDNQVYYSNFDIQIVPLSWLAKFVIQLQIGLCFIVGAWLLQRGLVIFNIWRPVPTVSRRPRLR